MLHIVSMWAEKILTRQHLCTVSSEPTLVTYAPYSINVSREDSDETALVHSLLWAFSGHLCSICLCIGAGKILTRLNLCTVSSEPSLVTYAQYVCVLEQGRFWRDYTCAQSPLSLLWSLMLNMFVYWSREDSDETILVHSLLWAFSGHLSSMCLCIGAGKILTRLHLCTVSSEPSLVTYAQYVCVLEQGRFWRDYTCAQSPLSLLWSLMLHIVSMWAGKILTRLHLCTVSSEPSLVTYAQYSINVSREDSDETALVHSLLWAFSGHLCSICLCIGAGKILTRLNLCTVSSEPSLVTYAQYVCVLEQGRFWRDYTCAQSPLSLLWSLMLNMFVYWSREDSDETILVHSLLWAFSGHLSSMCLCIGAGKILTRLHLCTVSFEPSLVTYAQYICVCEQGRLTLTRL